MIDRGNNCLSRGEVEVTSINCCRFAALSNANWGMRQPLVTFCHNFNCLTYNRRHLRQSSSGKQATGISRSCNIFIIINWFRFALQFNAFAGAKKYDSTHKWYYQQIFWWRQMICTTCLINCKIPKLLFGLCTPNGKCIFHWVKCVWNSLWVIAICKCKSTENKTRWFTQHTVAKSYRYL